MKQFVFGFVTAIIFLALTGFLYVWLGFVPVATSASPLPFEGTIARLALNARVSKEAPKESSVPPTEPNLLSGAKTYRQNCEICHGIPGGPKSAIAKGMYPPPPQLFHGKGVRDDPVGETHWKISNGIRLTGMPGFHDSLSDEQIWQVSELLKNTDKLSQSPELREFLMRPNSGAAQQ